MELAFITVVTEDDDQKELKLLKFISKFWSPAQWAQYLKTIESTKNNEEIYVGSTNELERYVARKSKTGFVSTKSIEDRVEFSQVENIKMK